MRAATFSRVGRASDVIEFRDIPRPDLGPDDVLVEVHTSGINPADVKRRGGWNGGAMAHPMIVPHSDGTGVIVEVGANVGAARIGERVWMERTGKLAKLVGLLEPQLNI